GGALGLPREFLPVAPAQRVGYRRRFFSWAFTEVVLAYRFALLIGIGLVLLSLPTTALGQHRLLVSNQRNNNVNAFDGLTGQYQGIWNDGPGGFYAWGIRQGPDGNVYVSTTGGGSVYRFNSVTGQFIDQFAGGNGILFALDI